MAPPQRRSQRIVHLDASVKHVEDALIARAAALESESDASEGGSPKHLFVANEFRLLAEELHWW